MKATLQNAKTAEAFELVWEGGDRITVVGFGPVTFATLDPNTAARLAEIKDADGNPLYVKKKESTAAPKPTKPDKS